MKDENFEPIDELPHYPKIDWDEERNLEDEANGSLFMAVAFSLACWLVGLGIWKAYELLCEMVGVALS